MSPSSIDEVFRTLENLQKLFVEKEKIEVHDDSGRKLACQSSELALLYAKWPVAAR